MHLPKRTPVRMYQPKSYIATCLPYKCTPASAHRLLDPSLSLVNTRNSEARTERHVRPIQLAIGTVPHIPSHSDVSRFCTRIQQTFIKMASSESSSPRFTDLARTARKQFKKLHSQTVKHLHHFHTTLHKLPPFIQSTRQNVYSATAKTLRKHTNFQTSDEYIRGAVDLFTISVCTVITLSTFRRLTLTYPTATHIPRSLIRRNATLHGKVIAVRDGDNLRIQHTPFVQRLLNMHRKTRAKNVSKWTINVRLAAVDAPECASFGRKGQTDGPVAREWLRKYAMGRRVSFRLHAMDQYGRVVATVYRKSRFGVMRVLGLGKRNVSLDLVRAGWASLYTGGGAQYGGMRNVYVKAERVAKEKGLGMWKGEVVLPGEYKKAVREGMAKLKKAKMVDKGGKGVKRVKAVKGGKGIDAKRESSGLWEVLRDSYEFLKRYR